MPADGVFSYQFPDFAYIDEWTNAIYFKPTRKSHDAGDYYFKLILTDHMSDEPVYEELYAVTLHEQSIFTRFLKLFSF